MIKRRKKHKNTRNLKDKLIIIAYQQVLIVVEKKIHGNFNPKLNKKAGNNMSREELKITRIVPMEYPHYLVAETLKMRQPKHLIIMLASIDLSY